MKKVENVVFIAIPVEEFIKELANTIVDEFNFVSKDTPHEEPFIKSEEVCRMLQISKVTLTDWRKRGLIKYHKIGSRVFFKRSEILDAGGTGQRTKC